MRGRVRVPLFVVALALLGLIGLLAALQFRWLGQISDASRDRLRATLESGASAFARDFDAELTRAYLLFQVDPLGDVEDLPASFAARYDRWHATSKYPRLIKNLYLFTSEEKSQLQKFDPSHAIVRARRMARIDEGLARPCARHDGRNPRQVGAAITSSGGSDRRFGTRCRRSSCRHRCCRPATRTRQGPAIIAARDPHDSGDRRELRVARDAPGTRGAARDAERRRGDPVGGRQPLTWRPGDLSLQRNVQSRSRGARRRHGGSVCHSHAGFRSRGLGDSPFRILRRYSEVRVRESGSSGSD